MAANPRPLVETGTVIERSHIYHAEAHILRGELEHPIKQPVENYGRVVLEHTRRETLITQTVGETNIEGLISFKSGHTRVAGTQVKHKTDVFGNDHAGWVTLSTAVLNGFNVVDILTADRVVAQVSTEHPMVNGHVPRVTFLGTQFENLRIGGYPVEVELDLGLCGPKPEGDRSYLQDDDFLARVERQLDSIASSKGLPEEMEKQYDAKIAYIDDLRKRADGNGNGAPIGYSKLQCSLVKKITLPTRVPGVETFGNLIFIPNFGTVALAELEVGVAAAHGNGFPHHGSGSGDGSSSATSNSNYFTLQMLAMKLGCPLGGNVDGGGGSANGTTEP
jgi:hypothetical protein